jgi:hypothetical protein
MGLYVTPAFAIRCVEVLAATCVVISTMEYLARPVRFSDAGLFNWSISRTRTLLTFKGPLAATLDVLFRYPNVLWLLALRLVLAISLYFSSRPVAVGVMCAGIFATSALLNFRNRLGTDGADQIVKITFAALALASFGDSLALQKICLWFITLMAVLSYVTSGLTKLRIAGWRSGGHLSSVFSTVDYCHRTVGRTLSKNPRFTRMAAGMIIGAECSYPMVFVLPYPMYYPWIVAGLAFHAGAAVFMGLNTFFWAYLAAYPAIVYCVTVSSAALWLN